MDQNPIITTTTVLLAAGAVSKALSGRSPILRWGASLGVAIIIGGLVGFAQGWYSNAHPSDQDIDRALSEMADKYPLLKTISLEDPRFLPGAREIAKKAMANGDASAGMNALFEYAAHRSSALAPTIRRASDATVADLGAHMSRMIDYLSATHPDLCARLLRGSPFNPMQYPNEVQQLFEAFNTIEAKAYVEGKSAPPDGYPVANPDGKGTDESPATATLAAVAQDFTPEELGRGLINTPPATV